MAPNDPVIRNTPSFPHSVTDSYHQSVKQTYKCSIKVVSHARSHLHQPLLCLILLCLPALNLPLKKNQLPRCCHQTYLLFIQSLLARSFMTRTGQELSSKRGFFSLENTESLKIICSLPSKLLPSFHININKSQTEKQARFTGTCSSLCQLNLWEWDFRTIIPSYTKGMSSTERQPASHGELSL